MAENYFAKYAQPQANYFDKYAHPQPDSVLSRIGTGMTDPIDAMAQLMEHAMPDGLSKGIDKLNNKIAPYSMGLVAPMPEGGMDAFINQKNANYHKPEGTDWARLGGNIASPVNLAIASKLPAVVGLGQKMLAGFGTGSAISAATTPVVGKDQEHFAEAKTKQALTGGIAGGITPLGIEGLSRVVSPVASTVKDAGLKLLKDSGVNPTIGQTLGWRWNALEEKMQSLPIMGDMISLARRRANSEFETAAHNRALSPINETLPSGLSGHDALAYVEQTLKNNYDDVLTKIGAIQPDVQFNAKVSSLKAMVDGLKMPQAAKDKFNFALSHVNDSLDNNGIMTSEAFKRVESDLGTAAKKLGLSTDIYDSSIAPAVKQLQAELRDMLSRQAGPGADALKSANNAWANFKRVQNASAKLGSDKGEFTPTQYLNAVRAMDSTKDKAAFARGNALGQDLGDAGKSVLGTKVPNSGTADRLLYGGGALGSWMLNPAIPITLGVGGAMYSRPAQKALNVMLTERPGFAAPLAEKLRESSNYLIPGAGAIGFGLLNN